MWCCKNVNPHFCVPNAVYLRHVGYYGSQQHTRKAALSDFLPYVLRSLDIPIDPGYPWIVYLATCLGVVIHWLEDVLLEIHALVCLHPALAALEFRYCTRTPYLTSLDCSLLVMLAMPITSRWFLRKFAALSLLILQMIRTYSEFRLPIVDRKIAKCLFSFSLNS